MSIAHCSCLALPIGRALSADSCRSSSSGLKENELEEGRGSAHADALHSTALAAWLISSRAAMSYSSLIYISAVLA